MKTVPTWIEDHTQELVTMSDKSQRCAMYVAKAMDLFEASKRAADRGEFTTAEQWASDARNTAKWAVKAAGDAMAHASLAHRYAMNKAVL